MLNNRSKPEKKVHARWHRRNPSDPARILWEELRGKKLGVRFRRRSAILGYMPAFYCPAAKFVVEVNGPTTKRHAEHDAAFAVNGILVLRLIGEDVVEQLSSCVSQIREVIRKRVGGSGIDVSRFFAGPD